MHRYAVLLMVLLIVGVAVVRIRSVPSPHIPRSGQRCRHPISVSLPGRRARVLCAPGATITARALGRRLGLRGCTARPRLRAGDHAVVTDVAGCRLRVEPMSGGHMLTLGVPLDLNSTSETALRALPGIGPALAARIVEDRRRRGAYPSVAALQRVRGVGEKTVARLRGLVRVGGASAR